MVTLLHKYYINITKLNLLQSMLFLIVATLFFSILIRLVLAMTTADSAFHIYNGEFISILSPDPALYGYYATLLLEGLPHTKDVNLIEYVIYALVKFTPFSLDFVMYFAPAFFASLVAVPTILILRFYSESKILLFFAGLMSAIGYGYYSRTYLGYFDTDVLNLFFPMMIVYSMILVVRKLDYRYAIFAVVSNIGFLSWYHSSEPIVYALNGFFVLFAFVFFFKTSELYKVSILLGISIIKIAFLYKVLALAVVFVGFYFVKIDYRYFLAFFLVAIVGILYKIDLGTFGFHLDRYFFKSENIEYRNFKFLAPMQLVSEARGADFLNIVKLISGNIFIFVLSIVGYIVLVFRHKEFLLSLPLVGIGLISIIAGVRFHIFGVGILIIGYFYLLYYLSFYLKRNSAKVIFVFFLSCVPFYENYKSVEYWNTKVAVPVFTPQQVEVLTKLSKISKPEDSIVTWWDYGWPLWYYTGMKTLIDNGKHHQDNYIVSKILLSDDNAHANNMIHFFYDKYKKRSSSVLRKVIKQYKDPNKVFEDLKTKNLAPKKDDEKFLFIPFQMMKTIYTIYSFSNLDITTGKAYPKNIFWEKKVIEENENSILLSSGHKIDKVKGTYISNNNEFFIKNIYQITQKGLDKKVKTNKGHPKGLEVIMYNSMGTKKFYIMDDRFFNSLMVQLFFFDNYDKKYFEKLISTDQIKLYRVK